MELDNDFFKWWQNYYFIEDMKKNNRVLLGMSGGTDSSVAALLLQEAGYEVTGITFRFYELDNSTEYLDDARTLANHLGIEHLVYDARDLFQTAIIDYFVSEYLHARTPVPCILCNNYLKWPLLKQVADERNIYYLSTGHYVNKRQIDGFYHITCGEDKDKDQSFFLWGLPQEILQRMLLPMGNKTKAEVRQMAAERGFYKVARKKDSVGVCFCPMDYRSFLKKIVNGNERIVQHSATSDLSVPEKQPLERINLLSQPSVPLCRESFLTDNSRAASLALPKGTSHKRLPMITPGYFYDEDGRIVGRHEGFPFYTIGQRHGLGLQHLNRAVFVKEILPEENKVVIAPLTSLKKHEILLKDWNVTNPFLLFGHDDIIVKIRYRKQANRCTVILTPDRLLHVKLHEPLTSVAVGQAAAFYKDDVVLGGGVIVDSW